MIRFMHHTDQKLRIDLLRDPAPSAHHKIVAQSTCRDWRPISPSWMKPLNGRFPNKPQVNLFRILEGRRPRRTVKFWITTPCPSDLKTLGSSALRNIASRRASVAHGWCEAKNSPENTVINVASIGASNVKGTLYPVSREFGVYILPQSSRSGDDG